MPIVIINPNSTVSMTQTMLGAAQTAVPERKFEGWTSHDGPPAIEGAADGDAATAPLLDLVQQADKQGAEGIIIGCFDDTALAAASAAASCPVVGIGQSAYHFAALRHWRFSVVTTVPAAVPVIEENIRSYGLGGHCARVRAANVPVLDLETKPEASKQLILRETQRAKAEDQADAIILGCAGMVSLKEAVQASVGIPVLEPVMTAAASLRWLSG